MKIMRRTVLLIFMLALLMPLAGCLRVRTHHTIDPIEINVNVKIEIQRELENYFGDIDAQSATMR